MAGLPSVSVVLVRPLALALAADVEASRRFFAATDLTPALLADPDARVSPAQFCVAWAEAIRLSGNPSLALDIACTTPPGAFGVVESACRCAPTLGQALQQWCRYLGILDDAVDVALQTEGARACLRVTRESEAPAPASHELCFALLVRNARWMLGEGFTVAEVRFTHRVSDAHAARLGGFFAAPVSFGAPVTELVLDQPVLAAPVATADPHLLAILVPAAEELRLRPPSHPRLAEQVRRALRLALSPDDAQLEAVAKRLSMTARSLQRGLKAEGHSFQALRDQVRREQADRFLGQGLTLAEISFLLGFSEPSAFFRAFKRWTGLTPLERRAHLIPG